MPNKNNILVRTENLQKYFKIKDSLIHGSLGRGLKNGLKSGLKKSGTKYIHAVENVSIEIAKGETLGLVGESGCGKTTLGRCILRLHEPTAGKIFFDGDDITHEEMLPYRRKMQIIFQDPAASLNPRMTVGEIVAEPLDIHHLSANKKERAERVAELLERVGLNSEQSNRYPHEFSGGQQQRIGIARALAVSPDFIVCDEPISALDVSIQSQIVNMLYDMQDETGLTYLFIAHDISVVRHISHRIGVMYLGSIVELAGSYALYKEPLHPYTKTLLSAVPIADPKLTRERERIVLNGEIPNPLAAPPGCRFSSLCPHVKNICTQEAPILKEASPEHFVACHLYSA
ncbi:MAG: ABC transporter ATP-binding protein [Treponemataceae bacterium]|nr:MAG: ABC transporter ATP-binding protein [Treponemataceae bacterium]